MKINWYAVSDMIAAVLAVVGILLHMLGGTAIESIYYFVLAIVLFMATDKMRRL